MKSIQLFNSPIYWDSISENEDYLSPLGLGYIASELQNSKISVEVIDSVKRKLGVKEIIDLINKSKFDYIGFNIFTQNFNLVKYIITNNTFKGTFIIGGPATKSLFEKILTWKTSNKIIIVIGEAEIFLPNLINETCTEKPIIEKNNKKVFFITKKSVYFPKNISKLNLNRNFLESDIIYNCYNQNEVAIVTSRGCSFNCAFCGGARSLNLDTTIRISSKEKIITEISNILINNPEIQSIRILDDLFLRSVSSAESAIKIFSSFPNISWRGMIHATSLHGNLDIAKELKQSGCTELFIGIESGSESIRKKINKVGSLTQVSDTIIALLEAGINVKGYVIYGFPNETIDDFEKTYSFIKKIKRLSATLSGNFRTSVFQFRPYDGTLLYKELIEKNIKIGSMNQKNNINFDSKKNQFNFNSGNYSKETDRILDDYIIKTQQL